MSNLRSAIRSTIKYRSKQQHHSEEITIKCSEIISTEHPEIYLNLVERFKKVTPGWAAYYLKEAK